MLYELTTVHRLDADVCSADGDDQNLFVGTRDGQLLHSVIYKDDPDSEVPEFTYLLASKQFTQERSPAHSIVLLHAVHLAAVQANNLLTFFTLPEFAPASELRSVKDVQGVILNETLTERIDLDGSASVTVFTKKKLRQIKVSPTSVKLSKEVEYSGCLAACQRGAIVCVATYASYDLIDLDQRAKIPLFPVVQGEANPEGERYSAYKPIIISPIETEFLVVSGSPDSPTALGMFITLEGEITRGTLMFDAYPLSLVSQAPYVLALLSTGQVEIHDITSQEKIWTISTPGISRLILSSKVINVVSSAQVQKIKIRPNNADVAEKQGSAELIAAKRISDVPTNILLLGEHVLQALAIDPPLMNIDRFLEGGEHQKALEMMETISRNSAPEFAERIFHESAYVHQKAGLLMLSQMLFDDAMDNFTKGNIDPRILISLFPEFDAEAEKAFVYEGVRACLLETQSVDDIIRTNLLHSVDDEATLQELMSILKGNAIELLRRYLTRFRRKKGFGSLGGAEANHALFKVLDRTLLKILLGMDRGESKSKLKEFFETDFENPAEAIQLLITHNRWCLVAQLYATTGQHAKSLQTWKQLELGDIKDADYASDALISIQDYLFTRCDDALIWEYGTWLLTYRPEVGSSVMLDCIDSGKVTFTPKNVLEELKKPLYSKSVYQEFLESLVFERKVDDPALSNELVRLQIEKVVERSIESEIESALSSAIEEYKALPLPKVSYLTYSSSVSQSADSPEVVAFYQERAKMIRYLEGQIDYDAQEMLQLVLQRKELLLAARILLYGRLSKHMESLNLLVHDLKDFDSAEVYCYHGGISLSQIRITSDKKETIDLRMKLFPLLFLEYLRLGDYTLQFTKGAQLINRWGNYMDLESTLQQLPENWSISLVTAFLQSSLAQLSREKREALIKRSLYRASLNRNKEANHIIMSTVT